MVLTFLLYLTSRFRSATANVGTAPSRGAVPHFPGCLAEAGPQIMLRVLSPFMFRRRGLSVLTAVVLSHTPLFAHDMWIEPATFFPESGEIVAVRLRVGQNLLGDPLPRDSRLVKQFIVEDTEGRKPVVGRDGADPAGFVRAVKPGLLVIGYQSNASAVELGAEKFNQYLIDEGLDAVAALRIRRHETGASAHELFSRCAKSLILAGSARAAQHDRPLGFTLELVVEHNPYAIRSGQDLPIRLTYENRALAGALVVAMNRQHPTERLAARTNNDGRVRFQLRSGGMWLVKAVHMIPAPGGTDGDWASFWASLTFEARAASGQRN